MKLKQAIGQTWRSIFAFFLSFVVLGLMVWFTPGWVQWIVHAAGILKDWILEIANAAFGVEQPSALFTLLVGDTEIALVLFTLLVRIVVVTLLVWLFSSLFRRMFRRGEGA
jgi:hypothetical protein